MLPVAGALLTIFVAAKSSELGMILILMVSRKRSRNFLALIPTPERCKSNDKSFLFFVVRDLRHNYITPPMQSTNSSLNKPHVDERTLCVNRHTFIRFWESTVILWARCQRKVRLSK